MEGTCLCACSGEGCDYLDEKWVCVDEGMGNWFEARMKHFGMFTRVGVRYS